MEAVGLAASIITLVALAKELWVLSSDVLHNLQDAPQELSQISNQAALVALELECIARAQKAHSAWSLTTEEALILQQSLTITMHGLKSVQESCQRHMKNRKQVLQRVSWALLDRKTTNGHLEVLQRAESSLSVILHVLNLGTNAAAHDHHSKQNAAILELVRQYHNEVQDRFGTRYPSNSANNTISPQVGNSTTTWRYLGSSQFSETWKHLLNSNMGLVRCANEFQDAYGVYTRIPLFWLWGQKAIVMSASIRRYRSYWPNFQILRGCLSLSNVVSLDSEVVQACRRGDTIAVRDLFRQGKASPSDMSAHDKSLLWYAAESGSIDLTRFLLDAGTPMRSTLLYAASYNRQPQVARLLLSRGADIEVIGEQGFTCAFFLFGYSHQECVSQSEFIEILACNSFSNFNARDARGWTVLHRAATFGTAKDISALLRAGASPHMPTINLNWIPIFCTVCYSNTETLQELWKGTQDPDLKHVRDLRGWNLLHVAAGAGNFAAVPFLLTKRVDLDLSSEATSRFVPPMLRGKVVKPSDVARNCGEDAYVQWTEAVRSAGYDVETDPKDIDWNSEVVDGTFGGCECCEEWEFYG